MKRLSLLFFMLGSLVTASTAQSSLKTVSMKPLDCYSDDYSPAVQVPFTETAAYFLSNRQRPTSGSNRAVTFTQIGSAGNLFTILNTEVNRLDANNDLNSVVFIHRANPDSIAGSNVGQYAYAMSSDGGNTWSSNNGVLNPQGNNINLAGRYPNVTLYNPIGNTNVNNAYLSYLGAWLPFAAGGSDWEGYFHGVARLDNNPTTFTADTARPNNGEVNVAAGLCQSVPGIFWSVDWAFDGTQYTGILLYRGVWNPSTSDVEWTTYQSFTPPFDLSEGSSQATALNMAFDKTGQYGWIVFTGDITSGSSPQVMNPAFYSTTDGGATWSGPVVVDLSTLDNVQANVLDPLTDVPTTAFDMDIVVDANGNPHVAVVIGTGSASTSYSIISGDGLNMYDLTRTPGAPKGCEWTAILLDSVATFRGQLTTEVSEDNRPQASISPDGTKVIMGWLDTDITLSPSGDNIAPNLFTRAIDINTGLATATEDQTTGTYYEAAALFASFSPNALQNGNTLEVPFVVAELNPTLNDADPAFFSYGKGLDYDVTTEFVNDVFAPAITLNGANPMTVVQNTSYTEPGATALDNVDGSIGFGSFSVSGTVDVATVGTYTLFYNVTDAAGNVSCSAARTVNVVASPDATAPVVTLNGNDTIQLDVCQFYSEQGVTAIDNVDGDISSSVVVTGTLPAGSAGTPGTPGTYTLTYTSTDGAGNSATETRVVVISDLAPAITLLGSDTIMSEVCTPFTDPGYFAYDNCLGAVSVTAVDNIDTLSPGTYTVTYSATDGSNTSTATRTVIVTPDVTPPSLSLVSGTNTVYVYLNDTYTDVLPTADDCAGVATLVSDASTTVNVTSYGNYTVTYTATDNNGNTSTITRTVVVGTEPDPRFGYEGLTGLTYSFTDSSLYDPTQWRWTLEDGTQSTQENPNFTFLAEGTYVVCLEVKNQFNFAPFNRPAKSICDTITIVNNVGIDEAILESSLVVYPNPTSGKLNLDVRGLNLDNMNIDIYNTIGEVVLTKNFTKVDAQSTFSLDITGAASGIYLVRISTDQGVITKRVTLQSGN